MGEKWFAALVRRRFMVIILLLAQLLILVFTLLSRSLTSALINLCLNLLSLFVCMYIITRRDRSTFKLTWVFQIMLFPLFGGLFYLLFKIQSSTRPYRKRNRRILEKSLPLRALPGDSCQQACEQSPDCRRQIRYLQEQTHFPIFTGTDTRYLPSGEAMLEALLQDLEQAEQYIFLEYFIVQEGKMWNSILSILREKAASGVQVRLMYDDMGCFLRLPGDYARQLEAMGIRCVVFNPFRPVFSTLQNNRDHRKIAVIDGKVAYTGGINLADEYINATSKLGHWKDAAVRLEGKAAWSFVLMFLELWEQCTGEDEDYRLYYPWEENSTFPPSDGYVQPYADSPIDPETIGEHVYLQILTRAQRYVYINTPYLIVDDRMVDALCMAAKSGVDVRIVTPYRWDKRLVHITTRSYYRELIAAGVKIYEYTKGFVHAKTFVSDDTNATIGTTNLDYRSLYMHFECGVWLHNSSSVKELKEDFLETLAFCKPMTIQDGNGVVQRMFQEILRLFAPLM